MSIQLGDIAPDFTQDSTAGPIKFHDWIGGGWPPSCTTVNGRSSNPVSRA